MFNIRHQEQRISALKERIGAERVSATQQLRTLVPKTRRAALVGTVAWSARKALPLLQPLLLTFVRERSAGAIGSRLIKVLGVATFAFSVWRMFAPDRADDD